MIDRARCAALRARATRATRRAARERCAREGDARARGRADHDHHALTDAAAPARRLRQPRGRLRRARPRRARRAARRARAPGSRATSPRSSARSAAPARRRHARAQGARATCSIRTASASGRSASRSRRAPARASPRRRACYAVAVELVHNATLLHDDVVDLGDLRRGSPAARVIYGNAASIFGGDWLLVDALCRIQAAGQPEVLERMLDVVKEMVVAESLQLARRGRVRGSRERLLPRRRRQDGLALPLGDVRRRARGRAPAGARREALEAYGQKLGVAFQIVDDVLDVAGDPAATGKSPARRPARGQDDLPAHPRDRARRRARAAPRASLRARRRAAVDPELAARIAPRDDAAPASWRTASRSPTRLCERGRREPRGAARRRRARSALESVALATPRRRR